MRPRHYAADNNPARHSPAPSVRASMRPRHYAADNFDLLNVDVPAPPASMRPRHYAADNAVLILQVPSTVACFNEAAALRRG